MTLDLPVSVTVSYANISPDQFAQWLRGFMDASDGTLTSQQIEKIRQKLGTVTTPPQPYLWPVQPVTPWWMEAPYHYHVTCAGNLLGRSSRTTRSPSEGTPMRPEWTLADEQA